MLHVKCNLAEIHQCRRETHFRHRGKTIMKKARRLDDRRAWVSRAMTASGYFFSTASSSTSKISVLFGPIFGLGLCSP